MSLVKIQGNASGTGTLTIAAQNTNSNNTLTIPNTTGNIITSGDSGTVSQTMLATNVAGNGPAFSAYLSANQSISATTWTKVQCNTKEFDTNSNYDNSTNYRFTPTVAGYYQVNASISQNASGTNPTYSAGSIYKNGNAFKTSYLGPSTVSNVNTIVSALIYFNGSTDYVELYAFNQSATARLDGGAAATYFQASMVRSA